MRAPNLQISVEQRLFDAITRNPDWKISLESLLARHYLADQVQPVRRRGRPKATDPAVKANIRLPASQLEEVRARGRPSDVIRDALREYLNPAPRTAVDTLSRAGSGRIRI